MALKAYEAYICHNEFSVDELPQKMTNNRPIGVKENT